MKRAKRMETKCTVIGSTQVRFTIKGAQSYFSKFIVFYFIWRIINQSYIFKNWIKTVKPFGCTMQFCHFQLPICWTCYASLIMVIITRHVSSISSKQNFKVQHGLWEKYELSCDTKMIPKSPQVWKKKSWTNRTRLL